MEGYLRGYRIKRGMKLDLCFNPRLITLDEIEGNLPEIREVFKRHGVSIAYLFGSILYEDKERLRDVDIGVYIKAPQRSSIDYYTDIYFDICDIFRADNIDLSILNSTGPLFGYRVISTGRVIYSASPDVAIWFIEETLFYYEDMKGLYREDRENTFRAAKEGLLMYKRMIDREKINTFLKHMNRSLNELKALGKEIKDFSEFISEDRERVRNRDLCIHHLRLCLESVLDCCRHIIAAKGFTIPDMEKENLIDILGKEEVIPYQFSQKIREMQGMSNAILHVYWNLDFKKVYEMVTENLKDFEDFARYVVEYVEGEYTR